MPLPIWSNGPCHRFDEQVVLALKMPVEAPFGQAYLLHHRPDAAAVPAALAEKRAATERMFSWFCALCSNDYRMA
jgi:hypothetical protein